MKRVTIDRSRSVRLLELSAVVSFWSLVATLVTRLVRHAEDLADWLAIGLAGVVGYLFADFVSGLFHWGGDTLGDERTPILGPSIIATFREHHVDQKAITRHGFLEINAATCFASVPLLGATALAAPAPERFGLFVIAFFVSSGLFGFATNQFHKWAHADSAPRIVRLLQRAGIILSPQRHAIHHAAPHDRHYCITVGIMSEPLDRIGFFRGLERLIERVAPSILYLEERGRPTPAPVERTEVCDADAAQS